jgi:hypothetical protein
MVEELGVGDEHSWARISKLVPRAGARKKMVSEISDSVPEAVSTKLHWGCVTLNRWFGSGRKRSLDR